MTYNKNAHKIDSNCEKHKKYRRYYKPNVLYWGVGIENECYLEFENYKDVNREDLFKKRNRERYSVDYFSNYKKEDLNDALTRYIENIDTSYISVPIFLNANSFTKTDASNNSKTLYTKLCEPNIKFSGETLIDMLERHEPYFKNTKNNDWLFDGDTIEFNTNQFFNVKLDDVIDELHNNSDDFIRNINTTFEKLKIFDELGKVSVINFNYPFVIYMTNLRNVSMFNNGTLHYNITLPTELNAECTVKDMDKFTRDHSKAIKIIQWLEPFIISIYGAKDPFSILYKNEKSKFSKCSQRCAVSRYIGIGTYNSDEMTKGKILTTPIQELHCNRFDYWWYNEYYKYNAYNKFNEIGLDINFNKHYNHGIELRFFDHILLGNANQNKEEMYRSFEFIIYLMDFILDSDDINKFGNPVENAQWNEIVLNAMYYGDQHELLHDQRILYENIFNISLSELTICSVYYEIYGKLIKKYNTLIYEENKGTYTVIPIGKYSQFALKIKTNKINNSSSWYNKVIQSMRKENVIIPPVIIPPVIIPPVITSDKPGKKHCLCIIM